MPYNAMRAKYTECSIMTLFADHPDVSIGEDGWLFLRGGSNQAGLQLSGNYPLPKDFRARWRELFARRAQYVESIGAKYVFFIAPAKEVVYARMLPFDFPVSDRRPVLEVVMAAKTKITLVYPVHEFKQAAETKNLYGRHDTHWRMEGSVLAYQLTLRALGLTPLADEEICGVDAGMNDLGAKIGRPEVIERVCPRPLSPRHKVVLNNKIKPLGNMIVTEIDDANLPTAVVFRDSFMSHSIGLFAQHFRQMTTLWQPNFDWTALERLKPDFIISEQAERFLVDCPDDVNGKTSEQYAAQKLAKAAAHARRSR